MFSHDERATLREALEMCQLHYKVQSVRRDLAKQRIAAIDALFAKLEDAPQAQTLDSPDGAGWWAFEGAEWTVERVPCTEKEADYVDEGEWDEGDEPDVRYFKRVERQGEPFQAVLEVKWVHPGQSICSRKQSGPHEGEAVLGFVSPKYRWNHALYDVETLSGKWTRVVLPWSGEK